MLVPVPNVSTRILTPHHAIYTRVYVCFGGTFCVRSEQHIRLHEPAVQAKMGTWTGHNQEVTYSDNSPVIVSRHFIFVIVRSHVCDLLIVTCTLLWCVVVHNAVNVIVSCQCMCFLNPSPASAAYRRQWIGSVLVLIIVCRLFGAKPLSKPTLDYFNWTLRNKVQWNFNQNTKIFIHENASENVVCEMVAFFSRGMS